MTTSTIESFKASFGSFKEAKSVLGIKASSWDKLFAIYCSVDSSASDVVDVVEPLEGQSVSVSEVEVVSEAIVEPVIINDVLENVPMFTAVSVDTLGGVFNSGNKVNLAALTEKSKTAITVNGFNGIIKLSNDGKFIIFVVKPILVLVFTKK